MYTKVQKNQLICSKECRRRHWAAGGMSFERQAKLIKKLVAEEFARQRSALLAELTRPGARGHRSHRNSPPGPRGRTCPPELPLKTPMGGPENGPPAFTAGTLAFRSRPCRRIRPLADTLPRKVRSA